MAIHKIPLFCLTTVFILLAFNVAEGKRRQENNSNRIARQGLDVEFEKPIDGLKRKRRELLNEFILKEHSKLKLPPEIERIHKSHHNHKRAANNPEAKHKKWKKRDIEQFYELTNTPNFIYHQKRQNLLKEHVSHKNKRETNEAAQIHNRKRRLVIISPDNIIVAKNKRRDKRNIEAMEKKKLKKHERSSSSEMNKHKKNSHKLDIHDNLHKKYKKHDAVFKKEKRHVKRYLNWREIMHQKRDQKREMKKAQIHASEHNHLHHEKRFEKHEKASKNLHQFKRNKSHGHSTKRQKKHV